MLGNWTYHSGETKNLSILDQDGGLDQVKDLPTRGRSIKPYSKMKSENSTIARHKQASLHLLVSGNVEITPNAPKQIPPTE
jgi:hypothetical protein